MPSPFVQTLSSVSHTVCIRDKKSPLLNPQTPRRVSEASDRWAALCGAGKAQSASESRWWMAFVRPFGDCIITTVPWIQASVYFVVQCNSHNFKRGRVAVNGWGHQWFTWPLAVRTLWNGVLKAEHQRVSSGPANSHDDCKRKGNSSLLGMGQWAIALVTPAQMEKYHHP